MSEKLTPPQAIEEIRKTLRDFHVTDLGLREATWRILSRVQEPPTTETIGKSESNSESPLQKEMNRLAQGRIMTRSKHPSFPELATTTLPEPENFVPEIARYFQFIGEQIAGGIQVAEEGFIVETEETFEHALVILNIMARLWHDPHCECKTKAVGGNVVEFKVCLRCANVRRQIGERL